MNRVSSSQGHRPCMAMWNPDASSKRGWRSRPWIGVYRSLTKWGRGTSLPRSSLIMGWFLLPFLHDFCMDFHIDSRGHGRSSMKHPLDVMRVGAWNSLWNFRLQITVARWIHNYILIHSYASFDSNAIPIPSLTPYNWVFTANLDTPKGAGNVILQQATCICLIGWELNHNFYECLQRIFIPCATCLYYFPLQRSCPRKPVIGSLIYKTDVERR